MINRKEQENFAVEKALSLLKKGDRLVYLSHFGSVLYGTNSEKSDCDLKGIFIPSVESLILGNNSNHYTYSSCSDFSKNQSIDIDIELWSIQKWLKMLGAGDTGALDLLFSMYATHITPLVNENVIKEYYENPSSLIDIRNNKSYIGYAYGQAKKYGLKGSRMGLLKDILVFMEKYKTNNMLDEKVENIFPEIIDNFGHESYCFLKPSSKNENDNILFILGKGYCHSIKISEMITRLEDTYNKYGERARQAAENQNIDWKALSHALRCLFQVEELINEGFIHFPLKKAKLIKDVKYGKFTWDETEKMIIEHLKYIEEHLSDVKENKNFYKNHKNIILSHYNDIRN